MATTEAIVAFGVATVDPHRTSPAPQVTTDHLATVGSPWSVIVAAGPGTDSDWPWVADQP